MSYSDFYNYIRKLDIFFRLPFYLSYIYILLWIIMGSFLPSLNFIRLNFSLSFIYIIIFTAAFWSDWKYLKPSINTHKDFSDSHRWLSKHIKIFLLFYLIFILILFLLHLPYY